jgi:hypothetical protein
MNDLAAGYVHRRVKVGRAYLISPTFRSTEPNTDAFGVPGSAAMLEPDPTRIEHAPSIRGNHDIARVEMHAPLRIRARGIAV